MLAVIIDNRINNLKTEDLASHAQTKMSSIFTGQKNGGHVEVGLLFGGGIRHITASQAEVKEVPACVR